MRVSSRRENLKIPFLRMIDLRAFLDHKRLKILFREIEKSDIVKVFFEREMTCMSWSAQIGGKKPK